MFIEELGWDRSSGSVTLTVDGREWVVGQRVAQKRGLQVCWVFYRTLLQAVPSGMCVCMKVRVADLVSVPSNAWQEHGRPIAGLHIDFVIADRIHENPLLLGTRRP